MFSVQDVQDIFQSLPPPQSGSLPRLIVTAGGNGLVTGTSLVLHFERLMTDGSERQSLASLSRTLDADCDIVLELVRSCPHLVLLSEKELTIIPKKQRDSLSRQLQDRLTQSLVEISAFTRDNDVSKQSVGALVRLNQGYVSEIGDCLLGRTYEQALSLAAKEHLDRSLRDVELIKLAPDNLPGRPPVWLIERTLQKLLKAPGFSSQFYVNQGVDAIQCNPREAVVHKRDAIISQLNSGEVAVLNLRVFAADFNELYASYEDAMLYFSTSDDVTLIDDHALSNKWLAVIGNEALRNLDEDGFVDCAAKVQTKAPLAVKDGIVESVIRYVMENYSSEILQIREYVIKPSRHALERDVLFNFVKAQATNQWQATTGTPGKDVKFKLSDIVVAIPADQTLLRVIAQDGALEPVLAERLSNEISDLESQNEDEFAALWIERVVSRVCTYNEGLEHVEDKKLQDQLAELLRTYLQKELLPDTLAKAQSQGLVRSRKTQKNVQKLESALKAGIKDLAGVELSIEKFGRKQDIQVPDNTCSTETKKTLVGDMVRRMQKPKTDGPLLFLTLIVVLFAKHYPGVVYATGKFAPKLLKQLKSKLTAEDYERLENWKEQAKTGALSTSDKEAMRQIVEVN